MNSFREGWFTETGALSSSSINISTKCDRVLYREKSQYQEIIVFESPVFGRCLVLDDAMQCTEKDEFSYQEMIAYLPLNSHPDPKRVLIIGGGDGGVAREVLKHPLVEEVVQVEIDEAVVRVSKAYLPFMSSSFDNPKLKLHIEDGYEFVKRHKTHFDIIITDSSDPIGPAKVLFEKPYFQALFEALRPAGIMCSQAESFWFDLKLIKTLFASCRSIYKSVAYGSTLVPSYPSGQIGFLICCKDKAIDFSEPFYKFSEKQKEAMNLKYYSEDMHRHAFTLPSFVAEELANA